MRLTQSSLANLVANSTHMQHMAVFDVALASLDEPSLHLAVSNTTPQRQAEYYSVSQSAN